MGLAVDLARVADAENFSSRRIRLRSARRFFNHHQAKPSPDRPSTIPSVNRAWWATTSTAPGPSLRTSSESMSQRTRRPVKTANKKSGIRISKTPAANTKAFQGVGGGSIDGIAMAQNSCRSKRMRMASNRAW